ncbi:uncharacterized protein LOC111518375 [Drosophila willistoni]|uniref:uncharacterized protein LOC111518375 n=1 Tax=Drosophila willistoni TaxID=7260 RepID=UPI000C26D8B7|nr:uncharacterized protein LOC111518375 [Drosophila willistoni]XP_046866068.1 uncharacterized protein LOC111518375 [Drosophila willistoni]
MENLPEDCLLLILSYLDLKSQLSLCDVHSRFPIILSYLWQSRYKTNDLSINAMEFTINDLHHLFKNICIFIKKLRIKFAELEHLQVLTSYTYPTVDDLRFHVTSKKSVTDSDMSKIQNCFPNLKTLSPMGNFTGKEFVNYKGLENLTLSYCTSKFKVENLQKLMIGNRLKEIKLELFDTKCVESIKLPKESVSNLEMITIDDNEFPWFSKHFDVMNHLKELHISGTECRNGTFRGSLIEELRLVKSKRRLHSLEFGFRNHWRDGLEYLFDIVDSRLYVDILKIVSMRLAIANRHTIGENIKQLYFKNCNFAGRQFFNNILFKTKYLDVISFDNCTFGFSDKVFIFDAEKMREGCFNKQTMYLTNNQYEFPVGSDFKWEVRHPHHLFELCTDKAISYSYYPISICFKNE